MSFDVQRSANISECTVRVILEEQPNPLEHALREVRHRNTPQVPPPV